MYDPHFYLSQDPSVMAMISSSLYRCEQAGIPEYADTLPPVSRAYQETCRRHVSGHTLLIRESSPEYYQRLTEVLSAHRALLIYVSPNFDLYGRYGSGELKEELKQINLRFGTNVDEMIIGTNAVALAARSPQGVWTVGNQNYARALWPYAFYAFTVHSKYNRMSHVLLAVRKSDLSEEVFSLFKLIESTESIFSSGIITKDVLLKDAFVNARYSETQTENLLIIVGNTGKIVYANNPFYSCFRLNDQEVINYPLGDIVPELSFATEALSENGNVPAPRTLRFHAGGQTEYYVTCTVQTSGEQRGLVITAQKTLPLPIHSGSAENGTRYRFNDIIGNSVRFGELKRFAERISDTDCTVLIRGESGTGKELFAHSIHNASSRWEKPFVSVNCAAIPRDLIGSELFGYVAGAFTGASRSGAKGKFEQANGGTLFLDEIGEMPVDMQSVLLRVLEDGNITRIGSSQTIPVDVRLIVATNQNLEEYIRDGKFRLDLYYRLNIITLNMIPLREHKDDLPLLTDYFIRIFSSRFKRSVTGMAPDARDALLYYPWPGNIRELRNVIERAVVTAYGSMIQLSDLPPEITASGPPLPSPLTEAAVSTPPAQQIPVSGSRFEIAEALMKKYDGNKAKVAREMGIARSTLYRILNRL